MIVLGISAFYHDAAAAIVVDGVPIAFAEEERFSRKKHTGEFPSQAISYCLSEAGLRSSDIDEVAFYFNPRLVYTSFLRDLPTLVARHGLRAAYQRGLWTASFMREVDLLRHRLKYHRRISWVDHHLAHAAYVYYLSPFDESAILTMDSIGEKATTTIFRGMGHKLKAVDAIYDPHSLGYLYGAVTEHLGYKRGDGEGTVMALAAYGDSSTYDFSDILHIMPDGRFALNLRYVARRYAWPDGRRLTPHFEERFGPPRRVDDPIEDRHRDLACALQRRTEEAILALARRAHRLTGSRNLCLAGGVALNSVANYRVRNEIKEINNLYIAPAANDAGTALGAALWIYAKNTGKRPWVPETTFLGPSYSNEDIRKTISIAGVPYRYIENPSLEAATLLTKGKIIGWFQGRMESGPRALGHRSILADPSVPGVKDRINALVKFREPFRPFAPSVLYEYQHEWFSCGSTFLPYMLEVVSFLPGKAHRVNAVAHVDGTARIQSIDKKDGMYYSLIKSFYAARRIPMILNTSFNIKGKPIVCTPADAIKCFYSTGLDALLIGNYLLEKSAFS